MVITHNNHYTVWVSSKNIHSQLRPVATDIRGGKGCIENAERQNNPDQPEQTNFCECDHMQATESQISSLL